MSIRNSNAVGVLQNADPTPLQNRSYNIQVTNCLKRFEGLLEHAAESQSKTMRKYQDPTGGQKGHDLKLNMDLLVFPEWSGGLSESMRTFEKTRPWCPGSSWIHEERDEQLRQKIVRDVTATYDLQLRFVAERFCRRFGCAVVYNLFSTKSAADLSCVTNETSNNDVIYTQSVLLEGGTGKILLKYDKINKWLSFVTGGDPGQAAVTTTLSGGRMVGLATCYDVLNPFGTFPVPRNLLVRRFFGEVSDSENNALKNSKNSDGRTADAPPIVAVPFACPSFLAGFASWRMQKWSTLIAGERQLSGLNASGPSEVTHIVIAGANLNGYGCIVDSQGNKHFYGDSKEKEKGESDGICGIEGSAELDVAGPKLFWRTV